VHLSGHRLVRGAAYPRVGAPEPWPRHGLRQRRGALHVGRAVVFDDQLGAPV